MPRSRWVFFDVAPQPHHKIVDSTGVCILVQSPYFFENRFARKDFAIDSYQIAQELRLYHSEVDGIAQRSELEFRKVNRLARKNKIIGRSFRLAPVRRTCNSIR